MKDMEFLEEPLLGTIDSQLSEAVAEIPRVSNQELDPITRQKLILDAVRGLDVENHVTTQYYLHGDIAVKGKGSNRSSSATLKLPLDLDSELPTTDEVNTYFTKDRRDYVIKAIETETFEWIESYYQRQDRFAFRDVYLSGLPVYSALHDLRSAVVERNTELLPDDLRKTVSEHSRSLKRSLTRYPIFQDVPAYVTEFKNAVDPALEYIDSLELDSDLGNAEENLEYDFVNGIYQLFYEGVWKAVGQQMSYNTVEGPSAQKTRNRREEEINSQKAIFHKELGELKMNSDTQGIEISADVDRLPDLEAIDFDSDPAIAENELEEIPTEDPVFSILN